MSGALATYYFISFFFITYNAILNFWNNANGIFGSTTMIENEELFGRIFIILVVVSNLGMMILIILSHLFGGAFMVFDIIKCSLSYIYYTATYSHTLVIFAFCNIDDVTWGTKGLAAGSGQNEFYYDKINFVATWLFTNCIIAYMFMMIDSVYG